MLRTILTSMLVLLAFGSDANAQDEAFAPVETAVETSVDGAAAEAGDLDVVEEAPPEPEAARPTAQRDATYDLSLRELEDELNELKEDIFSSKARLRQLSERILNDPIGGSRAVIRVSDDTGGRFDLIRVTVGLDGNQIYAANQSTADLSDLRGASIFDAALSPGLHNLSVQFVYRGNGFGVFSYMNGYDITVQNSDQVMIENGMTMDLHIRGFEDSSAGAAYEERPSIEIERRAMETDPDAVATADDESAQ
ncbi:MAG: putative ubiquitin-RnfH superfamily antitoxin RatB of RatAB toxin-antitoxin module [Bradymonadia bacterium]|jgi:putative ubiquitin-RnfH superfamily antitoxin RatB of RatAB toxin-antitoxin module